ncbi:MAG: LysR family transcriptional regulator [Leptolyngbyaceae cyanobacterium MO_188.B28]|nr:LysR family transcriptional regulator [Leptolyngbyaceae cyanobacterium MO_188.B28]
MDLRSFDLNLLVVLHTLLTEQSVSKTAERLNLSQPATSAALNRLRRALNDPILVRDGLRMAPTPRAEQLAKPVQAILTDIENTFADPKPFDPSAIRRTFRIATNDYGAFILMPRLMNRLQAIAPGITLEVWGIPQAVDASLRQGEIDLAIADAWELRQCKCTETLFSETFTCLVREQHPRIYAQLTLAHYLEEHHALVSARGRVAGNVDIALAQKNLHRQVRLTLPHILAIPEVIASTDLIVTLATRIAKRLATGAALKTFPPPLPLDGFDIAMAWPRRMVNAPAIQWLCHELRAVGQQITIA